MYGLFSTWLAERVLGHLLHTRPDEPQAEQIGGTLPSVMGPRELRIKVVPILGAAFGGNYAYLIWDEDDPYRRAIVVDPADPYPVLRAAEEERLNVEVLLTTHWHFDHSGGNATFAREVPGLRVVASDRERGRVPALTERLADEQTIAVGRLLVTAHSVPGHTLGSAVFQISSSAAPAAPHAAFTGDTLFCGGCGRLFEGSSLQLHASLRRLRTRLAPNCQVFSGHEYADMLLTMAVRSDPSNLAALRKLRQVRDLRLRKQPSVPSTMAEECSFNPWMKATPLDLARLCGCEM